MKSKRTPSEIFACLAVVFALFAHTLQAQTNLQKALDRAAASRQSTVEISGDIHVDEDINISAAHSGITIRGKDGATLIFSKKISSWKRDGKFLKAVLPDARRGVLSLFVNGRRAVNAYLPKDDFFRAAGKCKVDEKIALKRGEYALPLLARPDAADILLKLSGDELKNAYLQMFCVWNEFKFTILSAKKDDRRTCAITLLCDQNYNTFRWDNAPRFRLVNLKSALAKEGEFFFDSKTKELFYLPRCGEDADNISAFYSPKEIKIHIAGTPEKPVENFKIENVKFLGAAQTKLPNGGIKLLGQAAHEADSFINISNAKNISINSCEFKNIDFYAVKFGENSRNSDVQNCAFAAIGTGAIRIGENDRPSGVENISVQNNAIMGFGALNMDAVAILVQDVSDIRVRANTIADGFYTGISVGWTWGYGKTSVTKNMLVENNKIYDIGKGWLDDMGGVYMLGSNPNSKLRGNEIYNVSRHRYGGWGIYNDAGSAEWIVENNYVHDCQDDSYFMNFGRNVTVRNNLFMNSRTTQAGLGLGGKNSYVYCNNIVVFDTDELLRKTTSLNPEHIKFAQNIYWRKDAKPFTVGGKSFKQWQEEQKRDSGSITENPHTENFTNSNPVLKKIGFKCFSLKAAGASKEVVAKAGKLAEGKLTIGNAPYAPPETPYEIVNVSDYSQETVNAFPQRVETPFNNTDRNCIVVKAENGKKFIRLSSDKNKQAKAALIYRFRTPDKSVLASFETRLNASSNFEMNLYCGTTAKNLSVTKGKLAFGNTRENFDLFDKWLTFEIAIPDQTSCVCKIYHDGKLIKTFEEHYNAGKENSFYSLNLSAPKGERGYVDIGEVKVRPLN